MKAHLKFVDISKGIAIILMVLGHSSLPKWLADWIYSFHMPFFFFISGLMTSWNKNNAMFILHKSKSLLVPLLIYSTINLIVYPLYGDQTFGVHSLSVIRNGWGGHALWFIIVLFISQILCKSVSKRYATIAILIFSIIGVSLAKFECRLPWSLSTVPVACVYMLLARISKKRIMILLNDYSNLKMATVMLIGIIVSFLISLHYRLDLASNQILPFVPLLIAAISGSCFVVIFAKFIENLPIASYILAAIGRCTFEILAFSQCIILVLNKYITSNAIIKYTLLVVSLIVIVLVKQLIIKKLNKIKNANISDPCRI